MKPHRYKYLLAFLFLFQGLSASAIDPKLRFKLPPELKRAFIANSNLRLSFETLPPEKQRAYIDFISSARLETTRKERVKRCLHFLQNGAAGSF